MQKLIQKKFISFVIDSKTFSMFDYVKCTIYDFLKIIKEQFIINCIKCEGNTKK